MPVMSEMSRDIRAYVISAKLRIRRGASTSLGLLLRVSGKAVSKVMA